MYYLIKLKKAFLEILFPPVCLSCKRHITEQENYLCHLCATKIFINKTLICPVCRARLADNRKTCHKKSLYLLAAAAFYDDETVKNLIWRLKYRNEKAAAAPLAKILTEHIKLTGLIGATGPLKPKNTILVPIPLHPARERQRGFNQSFLLAEKLAENLNLTLANSLLREKNTKPQAEIEDLKKRRENVVDCFIANNTGEIKGKNILLVDDVSTSGSTLNEAAKVLKAAGAKKIIGLVAARAR
ncbi:MAG: ComF family protein [Patescibacteria group bacterium]